MKDADNLPKLSFATQHDWETWLDGHHADAAGVWLKFAKKATGIPSVTYAEALESALCYGWIDGQKAALDEQHWLQRFTPRRPKSVWSQINREQAEALIAAGRMRLAGLRQVESAQAEGRWAAAYASQRTSTVPDDLRHELDAHDEAKAFFESLDSRNRYAILYRIQTAKKPQTRAARIQQFIAMLTARQKIYP